MPIHDGRKLNNPKKYRFNLGLYIHRNKKIIKNILIVLIILLLLLFPATIGEMKGEWIRNFFVTMFNTILNT
jgi:hypothetical protein